MEVVRSLTDEHVLRALMQHRRLTRAELAAEIGISKPTAVESVRRLTEAGLVVDTGERTPGGRGRGRVGSYYALAADIGAALAVSVAPEGIVADCVDVYGVTVARAQRSVDRLARSEHVATALAAAVAEAGDRSGCVPRLAVVSAADPVDRATGRLIQLPDAPFLVGDLDPVSILASHVGGPVIVDNDVNWAAQAERENAASDTLNDFAYLYLGEGLGCAIVSDGDVRRGHSGLAGEVSHLITTGPDGRATQFIDVFAELDLRQPGSTAIHVDHLLAAVTSTDRHAAVTRDALGRAIAGVVAAITAVTDPQIVILGGPWGSHPAIINTVATAVATMPRQVPVRAAQVTAEPALAGARADALHRLRNTIVAHLG
jgi:predicted NBD/HSP70 family sugar kinase